MESTSSTRTIRCGFSGFGPRNAMLVKYVVMAILAERDMIRDLDFRLDLQIFEENEDEDEAGAGYAWQMDCDATLNSDITPKTVLANEDKIPAEFHDIVATATDLAGAVARELEDNRAKYEDEFRRRNPGAYALLREVTDDDGNVSTEKACAPRGLIGRVQRETIRKVLDFAEKQLPEIQIKVNFGHKVVDTDFSNPTEPKLVVSANGSNQVFAFDFVSLANGTTGVVPVSDNVAPLSFSDRPNVEALDSFLQQHDVLDTNNQIKEGSRIGIFGTRLSAYDNVPLLLNRTGILVPTKDGWRLDRKAAAKYQGLITFISHNDGDVAPPRHAFTSQWPGRLSLLNTEEMHSIMMQKDLDWLSFTMPILKANVAAEVGTVPSDLDRRMTTQERMEDFHTQNVHHRLGLRTESGLLRAGRAAMSEGFGLETSGTEPADEKLVAKAPITREGRSGFGFRYAGYYDISQPEFVETTPQQEFARNWGNLWSYIAASPVGIQDMIAQSFTLGVATFARGRFNEVVYNQQTNKVNLGDLVFDVLIAPKVFSQKADAVLGSLGGKVKEVHPGVPEYRKGRFLQTADGRMIHAMDAGSGGHGASVSRPEGRAMVGVQWATTNDHLAGADWAATASRLVLLVGALKARGSDTPVQDLLDAYTATLPSTGAFDAEIASLKDTWTEVSERRCFLLALGRICPDKSDRSFFGHHSSHGMSAESRKACIDILVKTHPNMKPFYEEELAKCPPFNPVTRDFYFLRRHLTFTALEVSRIWDRVFDGKQ
ncbi:hypothetical protein F4778DRAFT_764955 [Xylariomycetidae sp. FL2044]|nr:hypothetical protein F4778DRAFT_764955 [Xylariomycetidae sp. FL2044]